MTRAIPSLLWLVGCGDCPTFGEIEVTGSPELATSDVVGEIGQSLADFAAWTGRDGVCVSEIRVEEEVLGDGYTGQYHGDWIEVEPIENGLQSLVRHELCHALDAQEDLSWPNRDLFPPESVDSDGVHYPTDEVRTSEAFARACDDRPDDIAWLDGLGDICGVDLVSEQASFMGDQVWVAFDDATVAPSGIVPLGLERAAVTGLEGYEYEQVATPGGDSVWLVHELDMPSWDDRVSYELLQVEARSRSLVATWSGLKTAGTLHMLRSSGDPVVIGVGETTEAWQLDRTEGAFRALSFPALEPDTGVDGAVYDEVVWALVTEAGAAQESLLRYDLATETAEILPLPEGRTSWVQLTADEDGLLVRAKDSSEAISWMRYQPDGDAWSEVARPPTWHGATAVGLGDGRMLARYSSDIDAEETVQYLEGLAVLDAQGHILLPDDACGEDVVSGAADLMMIGGEPWLWEWPNGWSGEAPVQGVALTRVVIE